jgi:hypothetical protein
MLTVERLSEIESAIAGCVEMNREYGSNAPLSPAFKALHDSACSMMWTHSDELIALAREAFLFRDVLCELRGWPPGASWSCNPNHAAGVVRDIRKSYEDARGEIAFLRNKIDRLEVAAESLLSHLDCGIVVSTVSEVETAMGRLRTELGNEEPDPNVDDALTAAAVRPSSCREGDNE